MRSRTPGVLVVVTALLWLGKAGALPAEDGERGERDSTVDTWSAEELLQRGEDAFLSREFEQAERYLSTFLDGYGENPQAAEQVGRVKPLLALVRVRLKQFEAARPLIDEALSIASTTDAQREELAFWRGVAAMNDADHTVAQHSFGQFYAEVSHAPWRRAEALLLFGTVDILNGEFSKAANFFSDQLPKLERTMPEAAGRAKVLLLHATMASGDAGAALELVKSVYPSLDGITQLVAFQSLAVELGAGFLDRGEFYSAITCLQRIWPQERLLRHQEGRLEPLRTRLAAHRARGNRPELVFQLEGMVRRVEREIEVSEDTVSFDAGVRLRLATAFRGLGRYREAALVLEEMLAKMPANPIVEKAAVSLVQSWFQAGRWPRVIAAADGYEEKFGRTALGASLPTVLFLKAEAQGADLEFSKAAETFGRIVAEFPESDESPKAAFMRGIAWLRDDANDAALRAFEEMASRYPDHPLVEDGGYWKGMAHSFAGRHDRAFAVMEDYLKAYPGGRYASDAEFRQAFSKHSLAYYPDAIERFGAFVERRGESRFVDEAKLLLGDALMATGSLALAIEAYASITPAAVRFFEDGWFKTGKALLANEKIEEARAHYEAFIRQYPKSNRVADAVYQSGRIHLLGGDEEAAREIYLETVERFGDDPEAHGVEAILVALPKVFGGAGGREALVRALDQLRLRAREEGRTTLETRCLWAKSKVLEPTQRGRADTALKMAALRLDPSIHNPRISVDCADLMRESGNLRLAEKIYREARKWHPNTTEKARLFAGLGYLEKSRGNAGEAMGWFRRCAASTYRPSEKAEASLEIARLQLQSDRRAARATLEDLLADASAPSRAKAEALCLYASILEQLKERKKALAYYERVYLIYGKHRDLVARAYLARGRLLEEIGRGADAAEVYRECLVTVRQELAEPEVAEVEMKLSRFGGKEDNGE